MKKKIEADLISLAHKILQRKNHEIETLQAQAKELYEKLTVLAFTEKHFGDIKPTAGSRDIQEKLDEAYNDAQADVTETQEHVTDMIEDAQEEVNEAFANQNLSDLFVPADHDEREEMELPGISTIHKMIEEMPDERIIIEPTETAPMKDDLNDITADHHQLPIFERKVNDQKERPKSLNDSLNQNMVIGMNDRLGFIKHLFQGSDQDYNRVISQISTLSNEQETIKFIDTMVRPDYSNWDGKEKYSNKFMELILAKFKGN